MAFLTVLGLSASDVIAIVITPALLGGFTVFKWFQADKEKHEAKIKLELDKEEIRAKADIEKEKIRLDAEVEKEKIRVAGEVEKVKEKSVGAEAVIKIWKEMDDIKEEMERLTRCQNDDHVNSLVVKETIVQLKDSYDRLVKLLYDEIFKR